MTTLAAILDIEFDFTFEGLARLGRIPVTWRVELEIDPDQLDKAAEEAAKAGKKRKR